LPGMHDVARRGLNVNFITVYYGKPFLSSSILR
jgi:hypothetical protein